MYWCHRRIQEHQVYLAQIVNNETPSPFLEDIRIKWKKQRQRMFSLDGDFESFEVEHPG